MLKLGSPAIDGVDGNVMLAFDQRGETRPAGMGFDIGAVERQDNDSQSGALVVVVAAPTLARGTSCSGERDNKYYWAVRNATRPIQISQ